MRVIIKKWGNSASVRIPVAIMQAANLSLDETVDVREEGGRIVIEPVYPGEDYCAGRQALNCFWGGMRGAETCQLINTAPYKTVAGKRLRSDHCRRFHPARRVSRGYRRRLGAVYAGRKWVWVHRLSTFPASGFLPRRG